MRTIRISNPVLDSLITDIATDYSSGVSITARSNNSFAANDLAVFGNPAEELTELKKIDSVSGNTGLTLASALKFAHNKGTPIYKSIWDFVSVEGRSTSAGVFAELTQSGIQWDSKINKTIYFHQAGTDTWEYRFRFYNSVTATYSDYSPTLTGAGFTRFQAGYIIKEARRIAGDEEGKVMTTDDLLRALVKAKYVIRAHNPQFWFWRVDGYNSSKSITATANTSIYSLSSITDIGPIDNIEYRLTQNGGDEKYNLKRKNDAEFRELTRNLNRPTSDRPRFYRLLPPDANSTAGYFEIDNKIQNDGVGIFYISYFKDETSQNSIDDTTSIVIPEILEDYLVSEIYATKGNDASAEKWRKKFYGPDGRDKTLALEDLEGIALLGELDRQFKTAQGQPRQLWRFRGQKAVSRMYGNRSLASQDIYRENYFNDGPEV